MKFFKLILIPSVMAMAGMLLAGCAVGAPSSAAAPFTATVTITPNPCAPENIKTEAQKVHRLMREFDDASILASNTARTAISAPIADLQRMRRESEDLQVPDCLAQLKNYQLGHMNLVINTLIAFMGGADQTVTNQGIALARQQHDAYMLELARVLGITVVSPTQTAQAAGTGTPSPEGGATPASVAADTTAAPGLVISAPGPTNVNLRKTPALDAPSLGTMKIGDSATVVGKNSDGSWLLIEIPGQPGATAWVYTALVTVSAPTNNVPIVTPVP